MPSLYHRLHGMHDFGHMDALHLLRMTCSMSFESSATLAPRGLSSTGLGPLDESGARAWARPCRRLSPLSAAAASQHRPCCCVHGALAMGVAPYVERRQRRLRAARPQALPPTRTGRRLPTTYSAGCVPTGGTHVCTSLSCARLLCTGPASPLRGGVPRNAPCDQSKALAISDIAKPPHRIPKDTGPFPISGGGGPARAYT